MTSVHIRPASRSRTRTRTRTRSRTLVTTMFAAVIAMSACSDTTSETVTGPPPAPSPAPAPDTTPDAPPAPESDPLESLPAGVLTTRDALLVAARAGDWGAVGALIPSDTLFTSDFGGDTDHIAVYRAAGTDLLAEIEALLEGAFATLDDITVWPELYARVPFTAGADERAALEERFGADRLAEWEAAGAYLGWRLGITDAGEWIFLVEGD